ncbi:uncharacterized protein LOC128557456 [Mercenaria mercenaria]|uniref:uncharacterized protein LOC128557456 n=1 Tax=Mercenaria mercenaria TaxID=6596 RepID=UPI00234F1AFD|nr:uncharacterized protein LOC128557456 [Mercenaria mercenaria]
MHGIFLFLLFNFGALCSCIEVAEENVFDIPYLASMITDDKKTIELLAGKIDQLEEKTKLQTNEIVSLKQTIEDQGRMISILQRHCQFDDDGDKSKHQSRREDSSTRIDSESPNVLSKITQYRNVGRPSVIKENMEEERVLEKDRGRIRRPTGSIAFSAYLSHNIDHLSPGHTIKLDKVLLNDGNAYNPYTGTFTVPVSGVYMFSFHIDAFRPVHVRMLIDGRNTIDGVSSPGQVHEMMGGNIVIVRVRHGQVIALEEYYDSDGLLASADDFRFVTLSGILLYE